MKQEYLTIQEAARVFRVTDLTILAWARSGKFKAVRFGPKLWRIDKASLDAYHKSQKEVELVNV